MYDMIYMRYMIIFWQLYGMKILTVHCYQSKGQKKVLMLVWPVPTDKLTSPVFGCSSTFANTVGKIPVVSQFLSGEPVLPELSWLMAGHMVGTDAAFGFIFPGLWAISWFNLTQSYGPVFISCQNNKTWVIAVQKAA